MGNRSPDHPKPSASPGSSGDAAEVGSQSQQDAYEETVDSSMVDGRAVDPGPVGLSDILEDPSLTKAAASSAPPAGLPKSFGRYKVKELLGQGGFGAVYLGYDDQLDRPVAIKVPRLDVNSDKIQKEFLSEARQLAKLHHSGIVSVYDVGIDGEQCFIVSNYLEGHNLGAWMSGRKIEWQEAVRITATIADALAHAHAQRVVHRDLKPANIIMTDDRTPVIVDFGLSLSDAQLVGREKGVIAGTPAYMSPEQARGEGHRIDGRTDIYAVGVILYRLLTGQNPFQARNVQEVLRQVREDEPQPLRQLVPNLPRELERICLKAMAKHVRRRYVTAGDMAEELLRLVGAAMESPEIGPTITYEEDQDRSDRSEPSHVPAQPPADEKSPTPAEVQSSDSVTAADSLGRSTSGQSTSRRSREALRRRVTLLLCGCDAFTSEEIVETLDMEEQQEVVQEFQTLCRQAAEDSGGTVFQETTDGLLLCFGYPVALEDATLRAVRCGCQVLDRLDELNRQLRARHDVRITAYSAVHCDQAIVQDKGPEGGGLSIVGQVLNVVNQLEGASEPDSLIVTDEVHRLLASRFEWEMLGPQRLRGVGQKTLYRVIGERTAARQEAEQSEEMTPLIGRDLEVGLLQQRWEQAAEGMGQVVLVIGEAGLGKSRLVQTLKEHVRHADGGARSGDSTRMTLRNGPAIVEWRSSPQFQNSSLYPAIDYFERCCGFERDDDSQTKLDKLIDLLSMLNFDGDEQVALLAGLLSIPLGDRYPPLTLDPQRQKERTFETLVEWLRELSYEHPVLFVIEDLHWVDPTTLEFVEDFVSQGFNDSILTLLTFRPEFVTPWQSMAHQTQIALNRLTKRQIGEMVAITVGAENVPQPVIDQIVDRTDGVPLFVEEFTRMVVESDSFTADPEASATTSGSFRTREIPATLQDLLMARLDRINANIEVIQLGAAIGREFSHQLISIASPLAETELHAELEKLVGADVLVSRGRGPRTRYHFKHALIQDAAYGSLVKKTRKAFHRSIAEAFESEFPETAETQPELLALHWTEAGEGAQAIDYWEQAGTRSLQRRAHKEAIQQLRCGLELIAGQPESPARIEQELRMQTALGVPLQATIGYSAPEVEQAYSRAHKLSAQLGLTTDQFPVLYGMFRYYMLQAKYPKSRELGQLLLTIAEETQSPHYLIAANRARGGPPVYEGRHQEAVPFLERVIGIEPTRELRAEVDRFDVVDPWIAARSYLSWATWLMGYPDQSLAHSNEAVSIAEGLDHSFSQALALSFSQWVHQFRCDVAQTRATAESALAIAQEHGFAFWYGWCGVMRGWAVAQQGQAKEAIAEIRQGIKDWRAQGSELGSHYYYVLLAEACIKAGKPDEAADALTEATKFADDTGEGFYRAEIFRVRGRVVLLKGSTAEQEAEACFRSAIEVAREQNAKSLELRAARSLARLLQKRGDAAGAMELLTPLVDWFQEGHDTHDLKRSAELLETLKTETS